MGYGEFKFIFLRYILLLILGTGNLFIFYFFLTPLTVYPVFFLINLFYDASLISSNQSQVCEIANVFLPLIKNIACIKTTLFFKDYFANIIPACIAGSAYYLLLILNLTTPMKMSQRIKSLTFILGLFLILNIIRIFSFATLYVEKSNSLFDLTHVFSWYFGSTVLVILIWFSNVYLFKIKLIPLYSDLKKAVSYIKRGKYESNK